MNEKLHLTPFELEEILTESYETRFKIIKENIPLEFQFGDFEKNNRKYLGIYFKDIETNSFYYVECSYHNQYGFEFNDYSYSSTNGILNETPTSIIKLDKNIILVKDSIINHEKEELKEENIVLPKTEYQLLLEKYYETKKISFEEGLNNITFSEMNSLRESNSKLASYSITEMYTKLLNVAIPHKIDVDKLKNFVYSKKKHHGSIPEQILTKKNMIKKLEREIAKLEKGN